VHTKKYVPWLLIAPTIVVLLSAGVFPLVYSVWLSGHRYRLLAAAEGIRPVGFKNYINIFLGNTSLGISLGETLKITLIFIGICLALEISLGLIMAIAFSSQRSPGFRFLRILMMIPMLIAPVVVGNMFKYMYQYSFGLFNFVLGLIRINPPGWLSDPRWALSSIIITNVWEWVPFSFLVFLAAIFGVPDQQREAAWIDGANSWQEFWYIVIPGIKAAILIVLLIRSIELLKTFDIVYSVTLGGPGTSTSILPFNAYVLGFRNFAMGEAAAYGYYMVAVVNIVVILFIRFLQREIKGAI